MGLDDNEMEARIAIRRVIQEWIFYRDDGHLDKLRGLFSKNGGMTTNSHVHTADEFIAYAKSLREIGFLSHHFVGASRTRVRGSKAIAETQGQLLLRNAIAGVAVDNFVLVRYLDRFVLEDDAWKIEYRHPLYIKDRVDPVVPGETVPLDAELLAQCPAGGGQYLIYMSRANGAPPSETIPITVGTPEAQEVYRAWENWYAE